MRWTPDDMRTHAHGFDSPVLGMLLEEAWLMLAAICDRWDDTNRELRHLADRR